MEIAFLLLLIGITITVGIKVYNNINPHWHRIDEASANINVVMNKRNELTRRLSDIAGRYVGHERLIQLQVSSDRRETGRAPGVGGQPTTFFAGLVASFPELRADQTYLRLMGELTALEGEVQGKYEIYNAAAREYNAMRASLPSLFFAGLFGFNNAPYLEPSAHYQAAGQPPQRRMRIR